MIFLKDFTFKNAIYRASIFLVISCPCALAISVPLTIFAGIGSLSKKSIFVKGGNSIEALTDIDSIAFDKTGTVTKGEFSIAEVEAIKEDKNKILEIASAGEMYSTHPLGKAIARSHKTKKIPMHLNNIGGKGIEFDIDGVNYLVGNKKLMDDFNLKLDRKSNSNCIDVFVANTNEKEILGIIKLKDEIKEGVKDLRVHSFQKTR